MNVLSVVQFDLRRAPFSAEPHAVRRRACLDMVRFADASGFSVAGFSEHHNSDDGFLNAPFILASAAGACTQRIAVSVSALQLPLHDPLRVAEDIVALDAITQGRFSVTMGLGYRESEYQCFGVDWATRGRVFDQKLDMLLRALSGETLMRNGTAFRLVPALDKGARSVVFVGGNSRAAARRAARFRLHFAPAIDDPVLAHFYHEACATQDFDKGVVIYPREPCLTQIAEDPDKAWEDIGPYLLYDAQAYAGWRHSSRRAYAESGARTLQQLRDEGKYAILTPDEAARKIATSGSINLSPLCGGIPIEFGWKSLQLFAEQVLPEFSNLGD